MKVFFIVPLVTHYRETFFKKLVEMNPQHEWLIIDSEKKIDDGRPNYYKEFDFPHKRFEQTQRKVGPFTLIDHIGLKDFVKRNKPDIVILPGIVGTKAYREIASLSHRGMFKLVIWSCLWEHPDVTKNFFAIFKRIISKKYFQKANQHIAYSTFAKRKLISLGCLEDNITVAYNGIEIDNLDIRFLDPVSRLSLLEKLKIENNEIIFICVGGLGRDKNVDLLLRAAKILKSNGVVNFKLLVIGDGPQLNELMQYVNCNDLHFVVSFLGRIVDDVDFYFQIADCLIVPGAGGLSMNQAMYWGKPCIVAHADGTEEDLILDGITGFRFEQGDVDSLINAMFRFINTPINDKIKMGEEAKKVIIQQSNVNQMVRTFSYLVSKVSTANNIVR